MLSHNLRLLFVGGSRNNENHIRQTIPETLHVLPDRGLSEPPNEIGVPEPLSVKPEIYHRHLVKVQEKHDIRPYIYIYYVHESINVNDFWVMLKAGLLSGHNTESPRNDPYKFDFYTVGP